MLPLSPPLTGPSSHFIMDFELLSARFSSFIKLFEVLKPTTLLAKSHYLVFKLDLRQVGVVHAYPIAL